MGIYIKTSSDPTSAGLEGLGAYSVFNSATAALLTPASRAAAAAIVAQHRAAGEARQRARRDRARVLAAKVAAATTAPAVLAQTLARLNTASGARAATWRRWLELAFRAAAPELFAAPTQGTQKALTDRVRNGMQYAIQRGPGSFLARVGRHFAVDFGLRAGSPLSPSVMTSMTRRFDSETGDDVLMFTRITTYVANAERQYANKVANAQRQYANKAAAAKAAAAKAVAAKARIAALRRLSQAAQAKRVAAAKWHAVAQARLAAAKTAAAKAPPATRQAAQVQATKAAQVVQVAAVQVAKVNQIAQVAAARTVAQAAAMLPAAPVTASDVEEAADAPEEYAGGGGRGADATNDAAQADEAADDQAPANQDSADAGDDDTEALGGYWADMPTPMKVGLGAGVLALGVGAWWLFGHQPRRDNRRRTAY